MRIAIIGTGAMGSLLATTLCKEHDVVMVGRWLEQVNTIREHGLTLINSTGIETNLTIRAAGDPSSVAGQYDIALLVVKSAQTAQAAKDAQGVLTSSGLAISLQNGVGNLATIQRVVGSHRSTLAVTSQGATMIAPGIVRHAGHGPTVIGRLPELGWAQDALLHELCGSLNRCGWPCTVEGDVDALVWGKLAVNAAINPLTAILGIPNGRLLDRSEWTTLMTAAAIEVATVANARGITLDRELAAATARKVAQDTAENNSSMLQDVLRGAPTEIAAISGEVVLQARRLGLAAPVNESLLSLVRQIDSGRPNPAAEQVLDNLALSLSLGENKSAEAAK